MIYNLSRLRLFAYFLLLTFEIILLISAQGATYLRPSLMFLIVSRRSFCIHFSMNSLHLPDVRNSPGNMYEAEVIFYISEFWFHRFIPT